MTVIYFILMLGIIIAVHEFGHMIIAKLFNVYVHEYAIGFGPKIFSRQGKETLYTLRAIPLGGFTGMVEQEDTPIKLDDEGNPVEILHVEKNRTFYGVAVWKRICILLAGPVFNLLLACVVFIGLFQVQGYTTEYPPAIIASVMENSPAQQAGLQANDRIVKIEYSNGTVAYPETFYDVVVANTSNHDPIIMTVERNGSELSFTVTPKLNEETGSYMIGIQAGEMIVKELNFFSAIPTGISYAFEVLGLTVDSIIGLFTGKYGMEALGGTISIYKYTEEAASYGFTSILSLMGSLSVSVGLMNLIPISIFDGGRILLSIIEGIIGHRLSEKVENYIMYFGLGLVMILFVVVTIQDIKKLF